MNWQTVLYFSSILLTCLLTGFLAWYAWRQPHVTGARSYAYMVLAESLLALTEVGSLLAGMEAQASFWFSLRVLFTAVIPVFWLFFALDYSGRGDWLSKLMRVALFAIPIITQVVMVTSSLHGLWLVQDVAFEKIGPFWIADTSVRIPGLWYLVHTFYSTLLLVVGAGVLVVAAWRKPKLLLGQALLVSLGALTALGLALTGVFNLLPELRFNLFVPGIGFSAVCYALAIFRFQFLKRPPPPESGPRLTDLKPEEKGSLAVLVFIFTLFASGIAAASYITYQNYERQFSTQVENQLSAIAALKVDELHNWRDERLADASLFYRNENFSERVRKYLEDPQDTEARIKLLTWMEKIQSHPEFTRVFLLNPQGIELLSLPDASKAISEDLIQQVSACLASGEISFLDFHRHADEGIVHLSILIPIFDAQDDKRPLGVLVLLIDPNVYLYPFIQQWPVPSQSAETLLIRREGEDVLYLNELRFEQATALTWHFPLSKTDLPAARAVLGETGIVEGMDYRGTQVIADLRPVPDSPWFLVSKMDTAEVYAPLRERLRQTILFFWTLILITGAGLMLIWRQQRVRFYRGQVEAAEALRFSEEKFRLAFDTSPDSVAITRMSDGMFVSVNKGFEQISGYTREQVIGKTSTEINIWKDPLDRRNMVEALQATGKVQNYEAPFLALDSEIYGLMSAVIIELNGEPHILNIVRDITERKRAQEALRESEEKFRSYIQYAPDGVFISDEKGNYVEVNSAACHITGYSEDELLKLSISDLLSAEDLEMGLQHFKNVNDKGFARNEIGFVTKSGEKRFWNVAAVKLSDTRFLGFVQDTTESKQAEEALRRKNEELSSMLDALPVMAWIAHDPECLNITGNHAVNELFAIPAGTNVSQSAAEKGQTLKIKHLDKDGVELRAHQLPMQQAIATGQPVLNRELTYQLPDGRLIFALGNTVPLFDNLFRHHRAQTGGRGVARERRALPPPGRECPGLNLPLQTQPRTRLLLCQPGGNDHHRLLARRALRRPRPGIQIGSS